MVVDDKVIGMITSCDIPEEREDSNMEQEQKPYYEQHLAPLIEGAKRTVYEYATRPSYALNGNDGTMEVNREVFLTLVSALYDAQIFNVKWWNVASLHQETRYRLRTEHDATVSLVPIEDGPVMRVPAKAFLDLVDAWLQHTRLGAYEAPKEEKGTTRGTKGGYKRTVTRHKYA